MTLHSFSLTPFPDADLPEIQITGKISRQNNVLRIEYVIAGKTDSILFPEPSPEPSRKDELWTATCFEFFLALPGQPHYWEFNMSPSGDWNIYRMDAYRRVGFRQETSIQQLPFEISNEPECVLLEASVVLDPIIEEEQSLLAGITTIVQTTDKHETYWALAHPNPTADFHLRESFTLPL